MCVYTCSHHTLTSLYYAAEVIGTSLVCFITLILRFQFHPHSLSHSLTHSLTPSLTLSLTHSPRLPDSQTPSLASRSKHRHTLSEHMQCSVHGENIVVFCMHPKAFFLVLVVSRYHTRLQQTLRRYSHSHSLSHSLPHSLSHSLTHSLTRSLTLSLTHSPRLPDSQTPSLASRSQRERLQIFILHIERIKNCNNPSVQILYLCFSRDRFWRDRHSNI